MTYDRGRGYFSGTVYTDGSGIHGGGHRRTLRVGWGVVSIDTHGDVVSRICGPLGEEQEVGVAEIWAAVFAIRHATPP